MMGEVSPETSPKKHYDSRHDKLRNNMRFYLFIAITLHQYHTVDSFSIELSNFRILQNEQKAGIWCKVADKSSNRKTGRQ